MNLCRAVGSGLLPAPPSGSLPDRTAPRGGAARRGAATELIEQLLARWRSWPRRARNTVPPGSASGTVFLTVAVKCCCLFLFVKKKMLLPALEWRVVHTDTAVITSSGGGVWQSS